MENIMEKKNINLEVSIEETNIILVALSKLPYETVSVLIDKLQKQGQQQLAVNSGQENS